MTILIFISFNFIVYLIGRGFFILINFSHQNFNTIENKKFLNIELKYYFPIFSLFLIGNLTVLINFFLPVKKEYFLFIILFLLLFNLKNLKFFHSKQYKFYYFIIFPALLSISSYSIKFASDAGLYHLNTQAWIKQEKIHLGLVSLHSRYGYSSIFDYISANFWLENNFILLHFLNLIFINIFFFMLYRNLVSKENSYIKNLSFLIVLFGSLDNFGIGGGRNGFIDIEAVTKYDSVFAIMFFITALGLSDLIKENKKNNDYLSIITCFLIFTIQLRVFGYVLLLFYFLYIFKNIESVPKYFKNKIFNLTLVFYLLWLVKNLMISGCLVFPQPITCLNNISWAGKKIAINESIELQNFHISFNLNEGILIWFQNWMNKPINKSVLINYLLSVLFIYLFNKLSFKITNINQVKFPMFLGVFYIFSLVIWILSSPGIRFILGLLLFSFYFISFKYENFEFRFIILQKLQTILFLATFIFSLIFLLRIEFYKSFLENSVKLSQITVPEIEYVNNPSGWGVINIDNSSACWINIECLPEKSNVIFIDNFYNSFNLIESKNK